MRLKILVGLALSLAMITTLPAAAHAFNVRSENNVTVAEDEVLGGNFYTAGSQIIIDGTVTGDLFCAGATVTINGTVGGDVICAASSLTINGSIGGDVRSASSELSINGEVSRGLTAMGSAININETGSIGGNTLAFGATLRADGPLNGDVQFFGASLSLNNTVGGTVAFYGHPQAMQPNEPAITLRSNTAIAGDLSYYEGVNVSQAEEAVVNGSTTILNPADAPRFPDAGRWLTRISLWWTLWSIIAAIVIGFVIILLFPRRTTTTINEMLRQPGTAIAWGVLIIILAPAAIIFLAATIIGLPLALLIGLLFGAMWMIAKVVAAIAVGIGITRWFKWNLGKYWQMILGIIVAYLIFAIPVIGWIAYVVALLWGLGGIAKQYQTMRMPTEKQKTF